MPIPPAPRIYTCPACHWSKTVAPRSDALMPGDYFDTCPTCGHAPLQSKRAIKAQTIFAQQVAAKIQQWLR